MTKIACPSIYTIDRNRLAIAPTCLRVATYAQLHVGVADWRRSIFEFANRIQSYSTPAQESTRSGADIGGSDC